MEPKHFHLYAKERSKLPKEELAGICRQIGLPLNDEELAAAIEK